MVLFELAIFLPTLLLLLLPPFSSPAVCAPIAALHQTRLSLVSLFEPNQHPSHDFLTSIQAQSNVLDLHILQLVSSPTGKCEKADYRLPYNAQRSCMTRNTLAEQISKLLCEEWKCSIDEEKSMQARVAAIAISTGSFEVFQPLFGLLLRDSLPKESHWGWLQANTLVGDLESLFPFDLLPRFDLTTYLTNTHESIHLSKTITVLQHLPFSDLVAGADEFASSDAFLAVQSASTFSSAFWSERLLHSSKSGLNWIAVTQGLSQISETAAISLRGKRLLRFSVGDDGVVDVLREPKAYTTFTTSGEISPLHLQRVAKGEEGCTWSDGEEPESRMCPKSPSNSKHYRTYYMRVFGQLLERKEPLGVEDVFSRPEEVLFAPSNPDAPAKAQTFSRPALVLQT